MRHTLVALMEDRPAALNRVLGLLRGRALAVHSIAFGESETAGVRRITVVVETTDVQQTIKQLNRLIEVLEVTDVTNAEYVVRETALVKIHAPEQQREEIRTIAEGFGAKIVGSSPQTVVVETAKQDHPDGRLTVAPRSCQREGGRQRQAGRRGIGEPAFELDDRIGIEVGRVYGHQHQARLGGIGPVS